MRKYLMEAIGSFVLVIIVGLTNDAIAIGTIIAAMIAGGMQISGAHFNPAISFAFYLRKKLTLSTLIGYTVSQILGAFAAAGVLLMLAGSVFYVEPPISTNLYQQATVEIILTFILVFAFLSLISMRGGKSSRINAIGIGLTYIGLIIVGEN
ncbi:MAG: aquaporin, partial [Balneolales bacterium]|nr:aquaporin [Balneolales bacterium]